MRARATTARVFVVIPLIAIGYVFTSGQERVPESVQSPSPLVEPIGHADQLARVPDVTPFRTQRDAQGGTCGNGTLDPGETCDPPGGPPACDCCEGVFGDPPGCSSGLCETAICSFDSFCCNTSWDSVCAGEALAQPECILCCNAECRDDCAFCGDGVVQEPPETCDPPSLPAGTVCSLYGISQLGANGASTLHRIDPATGAGAPIGEIGFERVGGMDFHPLTGLLYATGERSDGAGAHVLITIDPLTGAGREVGPTGIEALPTGVPRSVTDLSFRSDGTLYGHVDMDVGLVTIDVTTGVATLVGQTGFGAKVSVDGIAFDDSDVLYYAQDDELNTRSRSPGSTAPLAYLDFPALGDPRARAMDNDPCSGRVYASVTDGFEDGGPSYLANVDRATGNLTAIGPSEPGLRAIAWRLGGPDCRADCTFCGDGIVQPDGVEQCDDGNNNDDDGCDAVCVLEFCGDGILQPGIGEQCDDGGNDDEDGCDKDCIVEFCGDGTVQSGLGEACDDGNTTNGDGCSAVCIAEFCGDGLVQPGLGETCDPPGLPAECALYGASHQGPDGPSTLHLINPLTGATIPIGPIGFERVGGMDFQPVSGVLFAIAERSDGSDTKVLIRVDPATGAGTEVGPLVNTGGGGHFDVSFRPNTTLFLIAFNQLPTGTIAIFKVSKSTGTATEVGDGTGIGVPTESGNALGFNEEITLFHASDVAHAVSGSLHTVNPNNGVASPLVPLTYLGFPSLTDTRPNAMDLDPCSGQMYISVNDGPTGGPGGGGGAGPNYLALLDPTNGTVSHIGQTVSGLDAIAWRGAKSPSECRETCTFCGDGDHEPALGEECDDGNHDDGDGCDVVCVIEFCGDGIVNNVDEECDDGGTENGDGCDAECIIEFCGDGIVNNVDEECDDGGNADGDGCDAECIIEFCGDGIVNNVDEECDDGGNADGDGCDAQCVIEFCGDGIVNNVDEECDDGGTENGDGCNAQCVVEFCGDGIVNNVDEECDDGGTENGDGCDAQCIVEFCGDGKVNNVDEECDDGNNENNDGCDAECVIEFCGDGIVQPGIGEECDPPGSAVPPAGTCGTGCCIDSDSDGTCDGDDSCPLTPNTTGASDCCESHGSAGCTDAACEAEICAFHPACCTSNWNTKCAAEALGTATCLASCGGAPFSETLRALDKGNFGWATAQDVVVVRGDLADVPAPKKYEFDGEVTLAAATSIAAAGSPSAGEVMYWLARPDCPLGSWWSGGVGQCGTPANDRQCPDFGGDGFGSRDLFLP